MLWLIGCGTTKTQIVNDVEIYKQKIPDELLIIDNLPKPYANNELDILNAYSMLFYHYQKLKIKLQKIKDLNN